MLAHVMSMEVESGNLDRDYRRHNWNCYLLVLHCMDGQTPQLRNVAGTFHINTKRS